MPPEPRKLSDEAQAAIDDAVRIVAEDRLYARMYNNAQPPKAADPEAVDPNAPVSPPAKEPEPEPEPENKKRAGLYWGEEL